MTVAELTQKVADLEAQLSAEQTKSTDLAGKLSAEEAKSADLTSKLSAEQTKSADLQGKLTAEETKSADLTGKLTASEKSVAEAKLDAAVSREIAARYGAAPKRSDASQKSGSRDQMTRSEFDQLSPAERSAFCRAGGKVTEA
jgi:septal ring factor EnvC (AmiA/AmiB activator)